MSNQKPAADNRSASQKIQDLENAFMSLYQNVDALVRDMNGTKEALKLLNNKLDSVVKASRNGESLTDEVISRIMIENNVEELANKVKMMVARGLIVPTVQAANDSFIVGSEINDEGVVTNPRLQFAMYAVQPNVQEKLIGAVVGDVVVVQEGKLRYKVSEIYQIQKESPQEAAPEAPQEQSTQDAPAEAPADQSAAPTT